MYVSLPSPLGWNVVRPSSLHRVVGCSELLSLSAVFLCRNGQDEDAVAEEMAGTPTFKAADEWHLESQTGRWTQRPRPAVPAFDLADDEEEQEETKSEMPPPTLGADQVVIDVADTGAEQSPHAPAASTEQIALSTPPGASRTLHADEGPSSEKGDGTSPDSATRPPRPPRPRGFSIAFPDGDAGALDDEDEEEDEDVDDHGPLEKQARSPAKRRSSLLSSRASTPSAPMTGSRRSRVVRIPPHVWRTTLLESSVGHRRCVYVCERERERAEDCGLSVVGVHFAMSLIGHAVAL